MEFRRLMVRYLAGAVLAPFLGTWPAAADPLLTYPLKIKGHTIRVEVANDEASRHTGLMFRNALPEDGGMIFVYASEEFWAMWMRNTQVPLSVAFIDRAGRIINVEDMQPFTDASHEATAPARYALEMNHGWFQKRSIRRGDRVLGLDRIPAAR